MSVGETIGDARYNDLSTPFPISEEMKTFLKSSCPSLFSLPNESRVKNYHLKAGGFSLPLDNLFLATFRGNPVVGFLTVSPEILDFKASLKVLDLTRNQPQAINLPITELLKQAFCSQPVQTEGWKLLQDGPKGVNLVSPQPLWEKEASLLDQKPPKATYSKSSPFRVALSSEGKAGTLLDFIQEAKLPEDCHILKEQAFSCTTSLADLDRKSDLLVREEVLKTLKNKCLLSFVADLLKSALKEDNQDWTSVVTSAHSLVQYLVQEMDQEASSKVAKAGAIRRNLRDKAVKSIQDKDADIKLKLIDSAISTDLYNTESIEKVNQALSKQAPRLLLPAKAQTRKSGEGHRPTTIPNKNSFKWKNFNSNCPRYNGGSSDATTYPSQRGHHGHRFIANQSRQLRRAGN